MPIDTTARLQIAKSDPDAIAWIFGSGVAVEDSFLYLRNNGDYSKYEEILLDPQVRGKILERVGALLGRSVLVDAAPIKSKADTDAADTARRIIDNHLIPYEQICSSFLLSGLIIGFSVQAVVSTEEKTALIPVLDDQGNITKTLKQTVLVPVLEFVPQRRFVFRHHEPDNTEIPTVNDEELDPNTDLALVHGYELRLLTKREPQEGERCSKNQFFTFTFGSFKGLPTGYGLGSMIRRFYEIRKECLKSGVLTGDRLGSPPVHGTYPDTLDSRDPEQAAIIGAFNRLLRSISPNAHAATTEGFKINFLEASTDGHTILKWLYETSGVEITRAIWGEGSYSEKDTGSYAAESQQAQNRNENFVDSDCNALDEQMAAGLWRWIGEKNYPKANFPTIRRETTSERRKHQQEMQDEELRSKRVTTDISLINDLGLTVTPEYISEHYGKDFSLPEPEPEEPIEETPEEDFEEPETESTEEPLFVEGDADAERDIADVYEERSIDQLTKAYADSLSLIQTFVEEIAASDDDEATKNRRFVDGIADLYERLDSTAIAQGLGDGLAASYFAGMYSER